MVALTLRRAAVLSAGAEVSPHGSTFGDGLEGLNPGSTPLHLAAYLAREDVVHILLSYGADRDAKVRRVAESCRSVCPGLRGALKGFVCGVVG